MVCDLAETYGIFNWRAIPARLAATLVCGLRPSSRVQMALSQSTATFEQTLSALTVDYLALLVWSKSEDVRSGRNRPQSIAERLMGKRTKGFATAEDFEKARLAIIRGKTNG